VSYLCDVFVLTHSRNNCTNSICVGNGNLVLGILIGMVRQRPAPVFSHHRESFVPSQSLYNDWDPLRSRHLDPCIVSF
jgi:hypothetical protein